MTSPIQIPVQIFEFPQISSTIKADETTINYLLTQGYVILLKGIEKRQDGGDNFVFIMGLSK